MGLLTILKKMREREKELRLLMLWAELPGEGAGLNAWGRGLLAYRWVRGGAWGLVVRKGVELDALGRGLGLVGGATPTLLTWPLPQP